MDRMEGNCIMVLKAVRTGQLCVFFLYHVFFSKRAEGWFSVEFDKLKFLTMLLKSRGFIMQGAVQAPSKRHPVIEPIGPGKAEERLTEAWKVN